MRILFIGDIVGRSGRDALEQKLPGLKVELRPDITIVNGENAAHGIGINEKICKGLYEAGTDCITSGNHIWGQREVIPYIQRDPKLLRPANFPEGTVGNGACKLTLEDGRKILIINAMGQIFMEPLDDPFRIVNDIVSKERLGDTVNAIFLDFHAEATSEKMAMAHYLDGRISALVGTHTHIPTADAHILPQGTGYQSDAGMSADYNSVIGADPEIPVQKFVKKVPGERRRPASGEAALCGVLMETDDETGKCLKIGRVCTGPILEKTMPSF